jgi:dissimilatory sulfite reductase related protein
MATKIYAGVKIEHTDEGYLVDPSLWNRDIAIEIARQEEIILTGEHFAIIEFLRNRFNNGEILTIRSINRSGIMDLRTFYQIFPGAPLKKASKIAGLPKPSNCI